jgi:hypothetical protein
LNVALKFFKRFNFNGGVEFFAMNVVMYIGVERGEVCYDGICSVLQGSIIFLLNRVLIMFRMSEIRYEVISWKNWLYGYVSD